MQKRSSRLPALSALTFFESAGRLMSFTRAAEELHVTQGAVSRQIQLLEEAVSQTLFERRHRAVELTAVGRRYHHEVSMALSLIRAATDDLATTTDSAPLTILATHAVSTYWLMPRLDGLRARLSGAEIQVLATDAEADRVKDNFDVAIRYGSGKWPGMESEFLGAGRVFQSARRATWPVVRRWNRAN